MRARDTKQPALPQGGAASDAPGARGRLVEAFAVLVAKVGYEEATVAKLTRAAGASRATFYQHFANREACFLAAYEEATGALFGPLRRLLAETTRPRRPLAVIEAMLDALIADPVGSRIFLVEAFAGPASIRREQASVMEALEHLLARLLDAQDPEGSALQIPAPALLAALTEVIAARIGAEEPAGRAGLRAELLGWLDGYRLAPGVPALPQRCWQELGGAAPAPEPRGSGLPVLLPRGRSALPGSRAAAVRRERLLDATAHLGAAGGYAALSIEAIAAAARVPRSAFYLHFPSKREAVIEAQTWALQEATAAAARAYSPNAPWPQRAARALEAFLGHLAARPDYTRLQLLESYAAGPQAINERRQGQMVFSLFLEEGHRQGARAAGPSRLASEAIVRAVFGTIRELLLRGRGEEIPTLRAPLTYTILAPFIGPGQALILARDPTASG